MALPQTVGFKAESVDEEGVWCACTVEEVDDDYVIISFDGGNVEWNRRVCDPCIKMYSKLFFSWQFPFVHRFLFSFLHIVLSDYETYVLPLLSVFQRLTN